MKNKNKITKKEKKEIFLKTCCDILQFEKLNEKEKKETLKLLKLSYVLLSSENARNNFIVSLKRKVGVSDE